MKKIINSVELAEQQMIDGMVKAHPLKLAKLPNELVVLRKEKKQGKVALVSGGGSGHEPAHAGYVGYGMLDAAVAGAVFTSPSAEPVYQAIKTVDAGRGVLMIIKNYTGDVLNFTLAGEQAAEEDGIKVAKVIVNDDVAVENSTWTSGRRGVAGTVFVHKIAGALAETGAALEEVQAVAQKVADHVRTMGMAIRPCTVPAAGIPGFELAEDEAEIGIGIHGEPGVHKEKLKTADEIADQLLAHILSDLDFKDSEVAVMINGCGGTPLMELYLVNNHVSDVLAEKGISVFRTFVGNYMTSLDMEGFSITLLRLDEEMKTLLDAPADTPALQVAGHVSIANRKEEILRKDCSTDEVVKNIKADSSGSDTIRTKENGPDQRNGNGIDQTQLLAILKNIIEKMECEKQYLTELDNVIGDGDHGINMARGFHAVLERLGDYQTMCMGEILQDVGKTLMKTVGGSSGPLYGSAFKKAGSLLGGKEEIRTADLSQMLEAGIGQIQKLGKAKEGEKTMLDAMFPALRSLKESQKKESGNMKAALVNAVQAAEAGRDHTKDIAATKGRASYLGERSIGHIDPGAASFALMLSAAVEGIAQ